MKTASAAVCASQPPLTVVLGPASSGKTGSVLARLREDPAHTLLVVSSPEQNETCLRRLAADGPGADAVFRSRILFFSSLVRSIVSLAAEEGYQTIGRTFQRIVLADLFTDVIRPDDFLGRMRQSPGFPGALAERIREWKLACITPELLEESAEPAALRLQDPTFRRKTEEFARLFRSYTQFLQRNRMRDEEDLLHQACAIATHGARALPNGARLLLVDGYHLLNPAQRRLLAALAGRNLAFGKPEIAVVVTLSCDPARPLLFAAPLRTLETLRLEFRTEEILLAAPGGRRPSSLERLEAGLFTAGLPEDPAADHQDDSPIQLFDAPNPYVEAEMVARAFRRLHDSESYAWHHCAIILRSLGDYAPILSAVFERYAIPLAIEGPEPLPENPAVKALLSLLSVLRHGWQREDLLAFLKSSYTSSDRMAADLLRMRARAAGVREGRANWIRLVANDIRAESAPARIVDEIARFDALVSRERAAPDEFARWIKEMIGIFEIDRRLMDGEPIRRDRDRAALSAAAEALRAVAHVHLLAGRLSLSFGQFHDALLAAWQGVSALGEARSDCVRVIEPYAARLDTLRAAAVMGLTERVFPRRITEDPFFRDEERAALRHVRGLDLEEQRLHTDDERFLFYLAVTAPSDRLILSFPRSAHEADTLPSFYLDEVRAVFTRPGARGASALATVSRTLADVAPRKEEAVCDADRLLAACADLFDPRSETATGMPPETRATEEALCARAVLDLLQADPEQGTAVRNALESRRLPRLPRLEDPELRRIFAGEGRVFNVSELETYARCPFQYFLRHTLGLRAEEDGANERVQGALLHRVLRSYFRKARNEQKAAGDERRPPATAEVLRSALHLQLDETLRAARLDTGQHRLRMTQRLLADALTGFAEREVRFAEQFGMEPTYFELAFGLSHREDAGAGEDDRLHDSELPLESVEEPHDGARESARDDLYDAASCPEPLCLSATGEEERVVKLCGVLDRVDLDSSGRTALALDYKLGLPPDFADIQRGTSLQMPIYLLALERLFGRTAAVGCYDSARETGRRRFHRTEHVSLRQFAPLQPLDDSATIKPLSRQQYAELIATAEGTAVRIVGEISTGGIAATPGDHCRYCPYADVCRTTLAGGHDGE